MTNNTIDPLERVQTDAHYRLWLLEGAWGEPPEPKVSPNAQKEAFEAWAWRTERWWFDNTPGVRTTYLCNQTQEHWNCWQAARYYRNPES